MTTVFRESRGVVPQWIHKTLADSGLPKGPRRAPQDARARTVRHCAFRAEK